MKNENISTGKGKLTPHRDYILAKVDDGASVSAIKSDLLRDHNVDVSIPGLSNYIKTQKKKRASAHASVDLQAATLLKEAVEIAASLTQKQNNHPAPSALDSPYIKPPPLRAADVRHRANDQIDQENPVEPKLKTPASSTPGLQTPIEQTNAGGSSAWNPGHKDKFDVSSLIDEASKPKSFFKKQP